MIERKTEQLGMATTLISETRSYLQLPIAALKLWLMPAIHHGQICFAFAANGRPIAYWTWAVVCPETELMLLNDRNHILHISEWNDGTNLWIMDFVAPHGRVAEIARVIRDHHFVDHARVNWNRTTKSGARPFQMSRKARCPDPEAFGGRRQLSPNDCAESSTAWHKMHASVGGRAP